MPGLAASSERPRIGLYPGGLAVDALTYRVFVANSDSVSMLDAHTGVLLRAITVGGFLGVGVMGAYPGVMANTRTGRIFVTDSEGVPGAMRTVVRVLDGRSGRVLRRIVGHGGILAIAARTGRVVIGEGASVSLLDGWTGPLSPAPPAGTRARWRWTSARGGSSWP
jgi:DNA-binding beta-propeller fold protein YncE